MRYLSDNIHLQRKPDEDEGDDGGSSVWDTVAANGGDYLTGIAAIWSVAAGNAYNGQQQLPNGGTGSNSGGMMGAGGAPAQPGGSTPWLWVGVGGLVLILIILFLATRKSK